MVRICVMIVACTLWASTAANGKVLRSSATGFSLEHEIVLPLSPDEAYDVITGDISGWWDHTFSENAKALYIEPRPGGCFCEVFDDGGDGVVHATVTYADRGTLLRMVGPLGLAGEAFTMSMTFAFEAEENGTRVRLTAKAWGVMEEGWDKAVDGVWHHFLLEGLGPYVESGRYKSKLSSP
jgi:hypothetical protein